MAIRLYGYSSGAGFDTGLLRFGGVGLGNLLFSWARCSIFCKENNATQIYTTWPQFKPGSWMRWESDKRFYSALFRPLPDEISGPAKLRLLYSLPRADEGEGDTQPPKARVIVFRGLRNYFRDIPPNDHLWLRERFFRSLKDQRLIQAKSQPYIGVHIRLGDRANRSRSPSRGTQLPLSWYLHTIQLVVSDLAWKGEIGICSDGSGEDLSALLKIKNVTLRKGTNVLDDLLYLSRSSLLIGSASTFSQWAAYLSGTPSIWHPGFDRKGGLANNSVEMVIGQDCYANRSAWQHNIRQLELKLNEA